MKRTIKLELTEEQFALLYRLRTADAIGFSPDAPGEKAVTEIIWYLVASICDGIRRPGSWERQVVLQLFGHFE